MNRRSLVRLGSLTLASASFQALHVAAADAAPDAMANASFDHVSLNVRDFDAMLDWYQAKLGFVVEVAWRVTALDGKRLAYLQLGAMRLELVEADADGIGLPEAASFLEHFGRTGFGHLCFLVDNVDATMEALADDGVPRFVRAETYDLEGTAYRRRVGFMKDPEGNVLEFAEPLVRAG